jgi:hypothetical protein
MKGGNGELFAVRWAGSSGAASPKKRTTKKKRLGRIWSPKTSCVDKILDCWFQCLNLVLCSSGMSRGRPHIGLRAGAWCAKSLQTHAVNRRNLEATNPGQCRHDVRIPGLSVSTAKDKRNSTNLRHVQMNASIGHVFVRISNYGVCLEPRTRTEHDETRPRHGRLVSGRRRCKSCCIAGGASAVGRPPERRVACELAPGFRPSPWEAMYILHSAALIRSRPNTQPQPGQAIKLLRRMAVIHRAAILITQPFDSARPPSIPSRFPRHRGLPDGQRRALEDHRLATGQPVE